ncbi:MAG: sigma-70 family RNA polymerase sigma factor [Lachnospiraceae bacterium]|nr:sigma-70 family RNA polymerase sigma factor [Lachnospiraceae bacterium]
MTPENVIRAYSDMVYRIAFARAGTKADADDIYQEVFFRYIRKNPEFRDSEHAKAWFIKVAVNCSRKFLGGAAKKREVSGEWLTENEPDGSVTGEGSAYSTPEERILTDESKAELYRELQKLSPDARLLLHLYYFEEMKIAEIAKLMHRKESTVRVQLTRAREKLKTQFEEEVVLGLLRA